jgi:signal transduction histidine kinase
MRNGQFGQSVLIDGKDDVGQLGLELAALEQFLRNKFNEISILVSITEKINTGLLLDDVLNHVFDSFRPIIPYHRIGVSLLEEKNTILRARWAKSDAVHIKITKGYSARMQGSSLQRVLGTEKPRILNDLDAYLRDHPYSESTQLIVEEGMKSSLTCPLIAMGNPIGFIFFSSMEKNTYKDLHIELFLQIAGQLSTILEKSRLYQQLFELNQLKNKFLGIAAHDLRNPIGTVMGFLKLFKDGFFGEFPEKPQKIIQMMYGTCEYMIELVSDLLDVTAIESGQLSMERKNVNLTEFLQECYSADSVLALGKSIELKLDADLSLPTISFDPRRIREVLDNLISNAIKFSHPRTVITIRARVVDNEVHIAVADEGQGIPEKEQPKVFDAFSKVSVRPTAGEKSTGLGLAIAKRMVEAHHGRIWIESEVGKGTTVTFSLPFPH